MSDIQLLYIDLFCGAGGTSTGVEQARLNGQKCATVIACVNHDPHAIASHAANHPDSLHFTEDIRTLAMAPLTQHAEQMRRQYPQARLVLWASLECTNFSKAKGGQPRDADSRTLAEHLFRYIEALQPEYIQIENVEEFMSWGELDENGHPVSRRKGSSYVRWVNHVCSYGYVFEWRILNAADYGAYTTRKRFFGQFARRGLPIAFPTATHAKSPVCSDAIAAEKELFTEAKMEAWKPVREVLDLEDEGESIFLRKKPLVEKTLERIYAGLIKFVAGGKDAFIVKWNSVNGKTGKYIPPSIDEPSPTVTVQNRLGVAKVHFLSKQFGGDPAGKNISVDEPAGTLTCIDHHALVDTEFLTAFFGNGFNTSIESPAPTLKCKEHLGLVTSKFLANEYSGGGQISDIERPCPSLLTIPKQKVVSADQFLMNPQYQSDGGSIDKPCFTLIARMDKMPPNLITTEQGDLGIAIYDTDSPMARKVKEFMAMYGIIDIKMRMLNIQELKHYP
ncbi:MAG: DNA cytosine methyltransferase [Prevotella sp.]|nr:DNA cytosine methyltransferase [Prevotella sp.]